MKTAIGILLGVIVTAAGLYLLPEDLNWLGLAIGQMAAFFLLGYDICPFSIAYTLAAFTAGGISTFTLTNISMRLGGLLSFAPDQNFCFALGAANILSYCIGSVCGFGKYQNKQRLKQLTEMMES